MYTMYIVILSKYVYFIRFFLYQTEHVQHVFFYYLERYYFNLFFFTVLKCLFRLLFFYRLAVYIGYSSSRLNTILYCSLLFSYNIYNHSLGLLSCALRFPAIPCSSIWQRAHTQIKSSAVSCPTLS